MASQFGCVQTVKQDGKRSKTMNDDFYIRLKILIMFCELIEDAVKRVDTTYLMPFVNSDLGAIASSVMLELFPAERKAFVTKLEAVQEMVKKKEASNG
jgi:hypothetical protein